MLKRHAYERAGVREYWLVHPTDRMLTAFRLVDGRYGEPVGHANIATTRILTGGKTRPEHSPTFKVAY